MRKHCKRKVRPLRAPVMCAMLANPEMSLQEHFAVEAIRAGTATTDHFNVLADCRDILTLAAIERDDKSVQAACELALVALLNMKDRFAKVGKIGATGAELQALTLLIDTSADFWPRQGGETFVKAQAALERSREIQREQREAQSVQAAQEGGIGCAA